eukprot:TRINITY_DN0_c4109_g1_i1.p2 TRINITY_DN0_c4109_g1~~TRINITY_DN0_c4109_g1_i1.p2  ORF type:complete len:109 (+),score=30.64 TRINITY_DN0_c4109_g1_i1:3-329(+)
MKYFILLLLLTFCLSKQIKDQRKKQIKECVQAKSYDQCKKDLNQQQFAEACYKQQNESWINCSGKEKEDKEKLKECIKKKDVCDPTTVTIHKLPSCRQKYKKAYYECF